MNSPGYYSLADTAITTALTGSAQTAIENLEGMLAASIQAKFAYGSGGTAAKAYVQTTLDDGITWVDIASFAFTTASATKVINLSGLTPKTTAVTPSDGALADDTCVDGVLGDALRVKLTTTGTYVNTTLSVKLIAR